MSTLRSPNEMLEEAKKQMLEGKEPVTKKDWQLVMNFFAANIAKGLEESACKLLKVIYSIPLEDNEVVQIAVFQMQRKV